MSEDSATFYKKRLDAIAKKIQVNVTAAAVHLKELVLVFDLVIFMVIIFMLFVMSLLIGMLRNCPMKFFPLLVIRKDYPVSNFI